MRDSGITAVLTVGSCVWVGTLDGHLYVYQMTQRRSRPSSGHSACGQSAGGDSASGHSPSAQLEAEKYSTTQVDMKCFFALDIQSLRC